MFRAFVSVGLQLGVWSWTSHSAENEPTTGEGPLLNLKKAFTFLYFNPEPTHPTSVAKGEREKIGGFWDTKP